MQQSTEINKLAATPHRDDWDGHWRDYTASANRNPAQLYRRQVIQNLLRKFGCSNSAKIVDIGSGQGDLAVELRAAYPSAIDHSGPFHPNQHDRPCRRRSQLSALLRFRGRDKNDRTVGLGFVAARQPRNPMRTAFFRMNLICTRHGHWRVKLNRFEMGARRLAKIGRFFIAPGRHH